MDSGEVGSTIVAKCVETVCNLLFCTFYVVLKLANVCVSFELCFLVWVWGEISCFDIDMMWLWAFDCVGAVFDWCA